jgi:hypothetical protein
MTGAGFGIRDQRLPFLRIKPSILARRRVIRSRHPKAIEK